MKNSAIKWVIVRSTSGVSEPRYRNILVQLEHLQVTTGQITWERKSKANIKTAHRSINQFYLETPFGLGKKNTLNHLRFQIHIWKQLQSIVPDVVYSCDLDTFLISAFWARSHHRKVVFDQFDPISSRFSSRLQKFFDLLEDKISRLANLRISANTDRNRNKDSWVALPNFFPIEVPKKSTPSKDKILFYGGVIQPDRGLVEVAEFLGKVGDWKFLVFGDGPDFNSLRNIAERYSNIYIHHSIDHGYLMELASQSSIFLALYDPAKPHNQFTSSNKLYEATQLKIPIITTKGTQIGRDVEQFNLGWTIDYNSISQFTSVLAERSLWSQMDFFQFEKRCRAFLEDCNYEKLLNNYRRSIAQLVV